MPEEVCPRIAVIEKFAFAWTFNPDGAVITDQHVQIKEGTNNGTDS